MWSRRTDLPLERDALGRFLPWLVAFMVYLAVLALAGTLILDSAAERWSQGITATLTVQIPPSGSVERDGARLQAALVILRATPEVEHAEALADERVARLLEPWIGRTSSFAELPLPRLIDVELRSGADLDALLLARRLAEAVPDATVDDHRVWLERLLGLMRSAEALASAVLTLIGLSTIGTVVFTTRTGLAVHHDAIEVLHLIGAQDSYVARQFAGRALTLGLRGGLIGFALAVPTLLGIGYAARQLEGGLLPEFALAPLDWAILAVLPLAAAGIAMVTARVTVIRALARMP